MSDETLLPADISDDACDECAPTERDPSRPAPLPPPSHGIALSVLWWQEGDVEASA